eukprot:gnl/MRDRNA2_/MRDRNA2_83331_c0_seq3.p1 gnl/MRDRNA2_/MRDRNA2_83331_c0~~gnl/MRDRNA2_/MRDRNA2_83331_c0_seq3.p1  ORF type:complete len:137 (+),score=8.03 gnl/MRDRNA2_/MRDRNA2_83331_c0_seq3:253-663(+)
MLFQAYHIMLSRAPRRKLVLIYQFCTSGGAASFLWKESYQSYCRTQDWPVYLMVTSGNYEHALGGFLDMWTQELNKSLHALQYDAISIGELFTRTESRYWEDNQDLRLHNEATLAGMSTPPRETGNNQSSLEVRSP